MSKRKRDSWQPGAAGPKEKAGTLMVPADGVKRVQRRDPVPAPAPEPRADTPLPASGTGRGLPIAAGPPPSAAGPADSGEPRRDGPSPFSGYAPTAQELAHHANAGAESSNQVAAIVMGMGFVATVVTMLVVIIGCLGLFYWGAQPDNDGIAGADKDKGHIRDTAVAPEIIRRKTGRAGPKPDEEEGPEEGGGPGDGGPTTGPVTIYVPDHVFFHSMEINCPAAGIRRRASFRGRKASTTGVPIREQCIVTFQGSEPAKTFVSGGQTKECVTFNPTECRTR